MKVDLVFPVLPPVLNGIGDHTAHFASALADRCDVRVLTGEGVFDPIPGVKVKPIFSIRPPRNVRAIVRALGDDPPDWLVLQFNQFSYGRWGLNPYLPWAVREIKHSLPTIRIAWVAHEDFVPLTSWRFAVMTTWQRWQFWMLGRHSDVIFFSIDPWVQQYKSWFPNAVVAHLPVGSNIPRMGIAREAARRHIGIGEDTFVAGVFGTVSASRLLSYIRRAAEALHDRTKDFLLLYVGPSGSEMRTVMHQIPWLDAGPLPADDVSLFLSAMDIHLAPFIDGVSTRRGSFMAGLQHGIPTVATEGELTDQILKEADGDVFVLAPVGDARSFERHVVDLFENPQYRARLSKASCAFYDAQFSWEKTALQFFETIEERC